MITPDTDEIRKALGALFGPDDVIEIRAIHKGRKRTDVGYFDSQHREALIAAAVRLNQSAAVYVNLNPLDAQLHGRYANRVQEFATASASDSNVVARRWFLIDIDPVRPAGTSANDIQLATAKSLARAIYKHLKSHGWAEPVTADSGNGVHLLYRVDLPNDGESKSLIESALKGLAQRFDTKMANVDQTVFNAARIIKLHGTVSNKGDNTQAAPWRLSHITNIPGKLECVTVAQLHSQAPEKPDVKLSSTPSNQSIFDLAGFLDRHNIDYSQDHHNGRERYKLEQCPFNPEHIKGEAAIFRDSSGALGFRCQHNSCADKGWKEVRQLLDGSTYLPPSTQPEATQGVLPAEAKPILAPILKTGRELREMQITIEWLVDGLIPRHSVTLLYGRGGIGKTTLIMQLANAIDRGEAFFGMLTVPTQVIVVDFENSLAVLSERAKRTAVDGVRFWDSGSNPPPLDKPNWTAYKDLLDQYPGALFVFDTLRSSHGGDENNSEVMQRIMSRMRELRDAGATVILLHHTPKGNDRQFKGSGAIFDLCDQTLALYQTDKPGSDQEAQDDDDDPDKVYRFGTGKKTRYKPHRVFLTFDTEREYFVMAKDPGEEALESLHSIICLLDERTSAKQNEIIKAAEEDGGFDFGGQKKIRSLLKRGIGRFWTTDKGMHNSIIYRPIQFGSLADPIGVGKLPNWNQLGNPAEKQPTLDTMQKPMVTEFGSLAEGICQTEKQADDGYLDCLAEVEPELTEADLEAGGWL